MHSCIQKAIILAVLVSVPTVSFAKEKNKESIRLYPQHNISAVHKPINAMKAKAIVYYIVDEYKVPEAKAKFIVNEAIKHGTNTGISPELVLAVIGVESSFKEKAVSSHGARGLMQVLASSHKEKVKSIGGVRSLYNPSKNILLGCNILAEYKDASDGNLRRTLLRYNGSLGNRRSKYPDKVMAELRDIKRASTQLALAQN